jgi:hypothetical protein
MTSVKTEDIENIKKILQYARPDSKDTTIGVYKSNLKKLATIFNSSDFKFLSRPSIVERKLKDYKFKVKDEMRNLNFTTIRNIYSAIIVLLEGLDKLNNNSKQKNTIDKYMTKRDNLNKLYDSKMKDDNVSAKQKAQIVDKKTIDVMIAKLKSEVDAMSDKSKLYVSDKSKIRAYTIFTILSKTPIRNDLANMIYVTDEMYEDEDDEVKKTTNYLVENKDGIKYFMFNDYKTKKQYGEVKVKITKKVSDVIDEYLDVMEYAIGDDIFPMSRNNISTLLIRQSTRLIGKRISTTLMRKIYMSDKYKPPPKITKEQQEDANNMMHSVETAQKIYIKNT